MMRLLLTLACTTLALAAQAAPEAVRVRGTIVAAEAGSITVHPAEGADVRLVLAHDVKYASVVASDLASIRPGAFIGTATKGAGSHMAALEVVVFPNALRGMGEGHYPWDKLPDTAGGGQVASTMTNGVVQPGRAPMVGSSMTNGTIDTATQQAGALHIAVSYKGGHRDIVVPAGTPVVAFQVGGPDVVKVGAQAFVVAAGGQAKFVAIGKDGLKPPM